MNYSKIYSEITNQVIENLETAGSWQKLWQAPAPVSLNEHYYSGINYLALASTKYKYPVYGTFNQIRKNGGRIMKGERSRMVVFYKKSILKDRSTDEEKTVHLLRYFRVFNIAQADFDDQGEQFIKNLISSVEARKHKPHTPAEEIVSNMPNAPKIVTKASDRAFYSPGMDTVVVPSMEWHKTRESYYSTLFHELTHSTGHPNRLNRQQKSFKYDEKAYSKEELVAELGAAYLMATAGLEWEKENSTAYIKSWASALKDNTSWITWAAAKAEQAVSFITNQKQDERRVA